MPLVATTTSSGSGDYSFTSLAAGYSYLVKVDKTDPDIQSYFNTKYPASTAYQISTAEVTASPNLTGSDLDNDFGFWHAHARLHRRPGLHRQQRQRRVRRRRRGAAAHHGEPLQATPTAMASSTTGEPLLETTTTDAYGQVPVQQPGRPATTSRWWTPPIADLPAGLAAGVSLYKVNLGVGASYLDADFPFAPLIAKTVIQSSAVPGGYPELHRAGELSGRQKALGCQLIDPLPIGTNCDTVQQGGTCGTYVPTAGTVGSVDATNGGQAVLAPSNTTSQYNTWDGTVWGTAAAAAITQRYKTMAGASSWSRDEKIVVGVKDATTNNIEGMLWDGADLEHDRPLESAGYGQRHQPGRCGGTWWAADVAYEQLSGDALMVWDNNALGTGLKLSYKTWNGSNWSTAQSVPDAAYPGVETAADAPGSQAQRRRDGAGGERLERHHARRRQVCHGVERLELGQRRDAGHLRDTRE